MHFVKQCGTKSISKVGIIKVCDMAPKTIIAVAIFGNQTVNVRIPLKIPAKSMKNHDVAGSEVFGFIKFEKHTGNDAVNCMKKTVKKGAVMEEKITEIFINGKNTVAMSNIDQFKRHIGSAFHGIFVTTSGTKAAVTTERDKFEGKGS